MGEALHLLQVDGWMDVALSVQFEEWGWGGGRGSTFYEKCSFRLNNKTACAYRLGLHNAVRL